MLVRLRGCEKMKDPHQNLFFYYGRKYKLVNKGKEDETRVYDAQLENNTTKALINLFEIGDENYRLLKYFLNVLIRIPKKTNFDNVNFGLQVETESKKTIPDASIIIDNDLFIYFENKITRTKENDKLIKQLIGHWKGMKGKNKCLFFLTKDYMGPSFLSGLKKKGINVRFISWMDVYSIIKSFKEKSKKENIFINQFLDYLKVINMAPFEGFEKKDFDVWLEEEETYNVKEKIDFLGKKTSPRGFKVITQKVKEEISYIGCNIFEEKICKKLKKQYYDMPHFSIGLLPGGLRIYLAIYSKPCVNTFLEKIGDKKQFYKLISLIQDLPEYNIRLTERKHFRRGLSEHKEDTCIRTAYFGEKEMHFLLERSKKIGEKKTNAVIIFEHEIPRQEVVKEGKDIITTTIKTLKQLFKIYEFAMEDYH